MIGTEEPLTKDEVLGGKLNIAMSRLLIASGAFFFAPFFVAFAMLSFLKNNNMWLPAGVTHPSMGLGVASVVLLAGSGLAYLWGHAGLKNGANGQASAGTLLALLLAIAAAICYALTLGHMGFGFQSGGYASVFFGLTFAYEIVLIGLCVFLFGIANRTRLGLYAPRRMSTVTAFAEFWWWFIIVGVLSYLLLYILPFLNIES